MAVDSRRGVPGSPESWTPSVLVSCLIRAALAFVTIAAPARALANPCPAADSLPRARSWIAKGDYARAEPVARRAVACLDSASAPHDVLGDALDVLVESLWRQGFATRTETRRLAERAVSLRDTSAARLDSAAASSLLNLGGVRSQTGDEAGAARVLDLALAIRTRRPGRDSLDYAWALNERGSLALRTGDLEQAHARLEQVLSLRRRALEKTDPLLAWSYSNLASVLQAEGDFIAARDLLEQCVRIRNRGLPPDHLDRARGLKDLANVLYALGDYGRARELYDQSLQMRIRILGEDHPDVANGLASQASRLLEVGDVRGALTSARRALAIRERTFDPGNPEIATSLLLFARILGESGQNAAAADSIGRALAIREQTFGPNHPVTAIALDRLAQVLVALGRPDSAVPLLRRSIAAKKEGLGDGHPDVARSWEILAEAERARRRDADAVAAAFECERISRRHLVPSIAKLPARDALLYESVRTSGLDQAVRIAALGKLDERRTRDVWDEVVRSRGRVLHELSARLRGTQLAEVGLDDVLRRQTEGHALVSYVRCEGERYPVPRDAEYVAFVANRNAITAVPLGRASSIDSLVGQWRAAITEHSPGRARRSGTALRARIWDPLLAALGDAAVVRIVPDGAIHGVSFYALPARGRGFMLEEKRQLEFAGTERAIARPRVKAKPSGSLLALGGITYGPKVDGQGVWAPLAHSGTEVRHIAALWNGVAGRSEARRAVTLMGTEATRARLRARAPSCEVLHFATHGVFAGEGIDPLKQLESTPRPGTRVLSVLQHSGLVLAPDSKGRTAAEREGFLSAADATQLDLDGVRWVVLSGCGTGSGRQVARAGVLGLRTAFEMAGARVVIMSLWNVEDRWAEDWMRTLYRERFGRGLSTGVAVREASRQLLTERRSLGLPDDPATWAAFVASGVDD